MKKLFSTFCALILVLSLVLVGCGNEIGKADGTYDAISSKQRTAYVKKLDSLRDVLGKTSLKTVATVTSEYEEDEDEDAADVQKCVTTRTLIADCTDPDNPKVYESLTIRFVMADGDHEVSIKAYYDEGNAETHPVEITASAPGKEDYSFKGQLEVLALYVFPNPAGGIRWSSAVSDLREAVEDSADDPGVKVLVDGNRMKVTIDTATGSKTKKGEMEAVIDADNFSYRISMTTNLEGFSVTVEEGEISATNETVRIPTEGYTQVLTADDFYAKFDEYCGF